MSVDRTFTRRELLATGGSLMAVGAARGAAVTPAAAPQTPASDELCFLTAVELARRLASRQLSAREVLDAHLSQIARINPKVNAICTLVPDQARAEALRLDEEAARGRVRGPLHGLPMAIKDLAATKGIRTTFGSRIYKDNIPAGDALFVRRLRAAGAVIIGKTNTPEFGAGSQTFNEVFGETLNPWDLTRTCGGSSGGAAVSLACGMLPVADGSDMGGSLRNPASFCNVVGLRPSPGRVPSDSTALAWLPLSVLGPMARNVSDLALLLSVMAGPDPRDPISLSEPGERFRRPLGRDFRGTRIAWSRDLGFLPVEPAVAETCEKALPAFEGLGCRVEAAHPDFNDADEIFQVLRAWSFAQAYADELRDHRELLKDTVIWNAEKGLALSGADVSGAETKRNNLYRRVVAFLEDYDFLVLPVSQVAPFPVKERWVRRVNDVEMRTYIDWMQSCYAITVTGLPAASVPCGFTAEGLPVGLQIVGRRHADFEVLELAYAFEQAQKIAQRRPPVAMA